MAKTTLKKESTVKKTTTSSSTVKKDKGKLKKSSIGFLSNEQQIRLICIVSTLFIVANIYYSNLWFQVGFDECWYHQKINSFGNGFVTLAIALIITSFIFPRHKSEIRQQKTNKFFEKGFGYIVPLVITIIGTALLVLVITSGNLIFA